MYAFPLSTLIWFSLFSSPTEVFMKRDVHFQSQDVTLAGHLYLPKSHQDGQKLPGIVVTGAWTTVKEQMPAIYAAALVEQGYAVLTFDFRGWGASPDTKAFLEDPQRKTQDILAAIDFLAGRSEVDATRIGGLGICASAGYMSDAALRSPRMTAFALVAPWLHNPDIVNQVYGGEEGVASLIKAGQGAAAAAEPVYLEAASTTNESALMYQAPYYTEEDRGKIRQYDNRFNVASWEPWLTFDPIQNAASLHKPVLLVHSESAAIPQGAKTYALALGEQAQMMWLDEVTQFDFYDKPEVVRTAVAAVTTHFAKTLTDSQQTLQATDEAAIRTVVEAMAVYADYGDFEALEKIFAEEILLDYTSLTGGEVQMMSPQALMTQWASVLPGFDTTKHRLSQVRVTPHAEGAVARAEVIADHYVGQSFWQVSGQYRFQLTNGDNRWQINALTLTVEDEKGTRDVFGAATNKVQTDPPAYLVRQQTMQAVKNFLKALEEKDMQAFADVWAEDAVQHMPFAPKGFPKRVSGKEALLAHYAAWPQNAGEADFTAYLVFYPMTDPEMIFAEFKGDVDILTTQRKYQQTYGGLFQVSGGKIQLFREYFDPAPFSYAFGLGEDTPNK